MVFSGAGISAESGINTFRDSDGLWENYRIEEVATPEAWKQNPDLVNHFYNLRRKQVLEAKPNSAHLFFQELDPWYATTVITQNIDDLHERAGSKNIIHLHGQIRLAKSSGPNPEKKYYRIDGAELPEGATCEDGFRLRPHVVWFGEAVPEIERAIDVIRQADIVIVIGTSLNVYPAAGLINYAPENALKIVVDPKANQLNTPSDFITIEKSAVESISDLRRLLLPG